MKIYKDIYIVGSGFSGFSTSNMNDCTVYLVDCGNGNSVLIDSGMGIETEMIIKNMIEDGFSVEKVVGILLTHGHGDHSGGAANLHEMTKAPVYAISPTDKFVSTGDIEKLSLDGAIQAGIFNGDISYHSCPVNSLHDDSFISFGNKKFKVLQTDGHCDGHASYLVNINEREVLFSGDSIFLDGKISLQSIWDCSITKYMDTIKKLSGLEIDILLPGHGAFALSNGKQHILKALEAVNKLQLPQNI